MTLTQYQNQEDPQRLEIGSVILQDDEVRVINQVYYDDVYQYAHVYVPAFNALYIVTSGSNILRTIGEDGKPKKNGYSVFSYEVKL